MNYQEFIEDIKSHISNQLSTGQKVTIHSVTKNNGHVYDGLCISDTLSNISPTIYLNPYYHRYLDGVSLSDIYEDILQTYTQNLPNQDFDVSIFTDFSKASKRIVFKLIHKERNRELLKNVPHIDYLDLAIVFVCCVTDCLHEYATILIHNTHMQFWNISIEKLYTLALQNAVHLMPYHLENMDHFIQNMCKQQIPLFSELSMYILTNQKKIHGASCIVYPGLLEKIAKELDSNLIIIPSSIHEVLIIPEERTKNEYTMQDYQDMIQEVNETQLTDEEILGDHAYHYNKNTGLISY